ncbi:isochorismatase-like hydrolase [Pseudomonas sp. M47T1]|uniref:isochorismatase family protein n=2 Tax=unclassified Pseudomonas TaxID=196821 RepID=UPI0002607311|nr:isochorismatase family protein [Pseudomonas sp. M47T1]EIK94375.1 isochorismatase-like hydrolase [Pseudomonas sp. M47T1]
MKKLTARLASPVGRRRELGCLVLTLGIMAGLESSMFPALAQAESTVSPELRNRSPNALGAQRFDIDAKDVQVLFVDLQSKLTQGSKSVTPSSLSANAAALAKIAKLVDVPVTYSIVPIGGKPAPQIPELAPYTNQANTYQRVMAGTFLDSNLVDALAKHKRKTLVVSGYATEVAVLQSVLGALKSGYTVYVVVDAIGSQSARTESAALHEMEMAGAIPTSVLALAAQLAPDFSRPPSSNVLATFDELRPPQ